MKGFTLIELMVVVLIVAVLAAVLVPLLTARLEAARWSEGKAGAGTIATSIRAMAAEEGEAFEGSDTVLDYVKADDLQGRWFGPANYNIISISYPGLSPYPVDYVIQVTAPLNSEGVDTDWSVPFWYLNNKGQWSKTTTFPAFDPPGQMP